MSDKEKNILYKILLAYDIIMGFFVLIMWEMSFFVFLMPVPLIMTAVLYIERRKKGKDEKNFHADTSDMQVLEEPEQVPYESPVLIKSNIFLLNILMTVDCIGAVLSWILYHMENESVSDIETAIFGAVLFFVVPSAVTYIIWRKINEYIDKPEYKENIQKCNDKLYKLITGYSAVAVTLFMPGVIKVVFSPNTQGRVLHILWGIIFCAVPAVLAVKIYLRQKEIRDSMPLELVLNLPHISGLNIPARAMCRVVFDETGMSVSSAGVVYTLPYEKIYDITVQRDSKTEKQAVVLTNDRIKNVDVRSQYASLVVVYNDNGAAGYIIFDAANDSYTAEAYIAKLKKKGYICEKQIHMEPGNKQADKSPESTVCDGCGSTVFIKKDGYFECPYCGRRRN